ncbi:LCP family protein [Streptomyces sp. JHA26]|uniref:LCP family protein n=1 Tax=Streptomyces sp. JHA26 TaxID=1917143 RepID=UPI00098BAF99|nr:LCP family protein [Streptomyces sp. JHA26]
MNDPYDTGYGSGGSDPYELVGYDEYGRPVYRQAQAPDRQQPYDPYAQQQEPYAQQPYGQEPYAQQPYGQQEPYGQSHGHDPYATGAEQTATPYDPYTDQGGQDAGRQPYAPEAGHAPQASYDPYGRTATSDRPPLVAEQTAHIPQQAGPPGEPEPAAADEPEREYRTEQFAFVEEPTDDSEDVIDWLKFTENRTERREEARRRARTRVVALAVVLALVAVGGVGYLWYAGKLPGLSSSDSGTGGTTATGAQKRDVIAVHLHDTAGGGTSTALLVNNTTTKRGTAVLLPNSLALTGDDGTPTTLARSVDDDGPEATRTALDSALGTDIEGSWRLDTPFLQILVDLVGGIEVDTDADVPDPAAKDKGAAPLVHKGAKQTLGGKMAVAYATHRGAGESADAQLQRFGQVLQGVLRKTSSDPQGATTTVQTLGLVLDPPLTESDLGSFLAGLSELAKGGDFRTTLLPVGSDGRLSAETGDKVVKDVLGGTAKSPDEDAAVSVAVRNATGVEDRTGKARVALLNGGFTFLEGGTASGTETTSQVLYAEAADKEDAVQVARTLGLPDGSVTQGKVAANADVSVVLGQDYEPAT